MVWLSVLTDLCIEGLLLGRGENLKYEVCGTNLGPWRVCSVFVSHHQETAASLVSYFHHKIFCLLQAQG